MKNPGPAHRFLSLTVLVSFCAAPLEAQAPPTPVVNWIRSHAFPIKTVEPVDDDISDLQPLKNMVGDARIVAIGEATHGTHEFFELKRRIIQFLASEMGFTMVSIEANMPEAYRINEFVLTGKGDPRQLLKGMHYWIWNTQELLDLILWMREFNSTGKGHLEFTGFDMNYRDAAVANVREFVSANDRDYLSAFEAAAAKTQTDAKARAANAGMDAGTIADASAAWEGVIRHLEGSRARYAGEKTVSSGVDWAIQNARVVVENIAYRAGQKTRDHSMAQNVKWILDRDPKAKVILWAHNDHVRTCRLDNLPTFPMGADLRNMFPGEMFVFGMAFDQGSFRAALPGMSLTQAGGLHTFKVSAAPQGSLDAAFASAGIPAFAIDLRHVPRKGAVADWWSSPRRSQEIGALFTDRTPAAAERLRYLLGDFQAPMCFDGMFFVQQTTAAHTLP